MLASSQSLKQVFHCPEESNFYSYCLESLVLNDSESSLTGKPEVIVEFGSGDGSPVIKSLLKSFSNVTIHGFELNPAAFKIAQSQIQEYDLSEQYILHPSCFFQGQPFPQATCLISNPPYLPAPDAKIYQPLLHGGTDGSQIARRLLSLHYQKVLLMVSSYSHPVGLINYALDLGYAVTNFIVAPMRFGYYSSEPKVKNMIASLRAEGMAFYSKNIYLLAGVLFQEQSRSTSDLSHEFIELMTVL